MEREVSHEIRRRHLAPEGARTARSFLWRSALVLFPILLLAGVGCLLLAKERRLARHEATEITRDISQRVADEIATNIQDWMKEASAFRYFGSRSNLNFSNLKLSSNVFAWRLGRDGTLAFPPPMLQISPFFEAGESRGPANPLYARAEIVEFQEHDLRAAAKLYDEAAQGTADASLKGLAAYAAGRAYFAIGNNARAAACLETAAQTIPDGASAGHIAQLAQLKLLSLPASEANRLLLFSNLLTEIIFRPTALSGQVLRQAEESRLAEFSSLAQDQLRLTRLLWNYFATSRALAETLPHGKTGVMTFNDASYLIVNSLGSTNDEKGFVAFTLPAVQSRLETILKAPASVRLPKYFALNCELAGLQFLTNRASQTLASSIANAGGLSVKVSAGLSDPAGYFANQRARIAWFLAIIAVAAAVAIAGLVFIRQGVERLQRVNELKDNFVASVSHELRAPVASIRLLGESLERGKISDQARQQEYFHLIVQQCRRLGGLVDNLLDFARQNRGREIEQDFQPINLLALVQENVVALEPLAREKGVALIIHPSSETGSGLLATATAIIEPGRRVKGPGLQMLAGSWDVLGDATALSQVIFNLVDNGLKFSASGAAIELTVMSDENYGVLSIRDHGPGIPRGEQQKIFDMFYRVGSELTRERAGVGIGLSLVKQIVELHQGGIYLESAPGKGSCFIISIPKQ